MRTGLPPPAPLAAASPARPGPEGAHKGHGKRWDAVIALGSGAGGLNPTVVQLSWRPDRLEMTANVREGLIPQHTCRKALDEVQAALSA